MKILSFIVSLLTPNAVFFEGETPTIAGTITTVTTTAGSLLTSILSWLSQFTTWILSDPLALLGFVVAFIMLGVHILHSLVKFSW